MNYRSAVIFGSARAIEEPREKINALRTISDHLMPGRWEDVRGPNKKELAATTVLAFLMDEGSSKTREGPTQDDDRDYDLPIWAGILPLGLGSMHPIPDERLMPGIDLPRYLRRYANRLESFRATRVSSNSFKQEN
jgi:uncharacterized protein